MTVFVYVNTSKQVGDPDHIKVFANADAAETWFEENDPEGVAFEYEVLGTEKIAQGRSSIAHGRVAVVWTANAPTAGFTFEGLELSRPKVFSPHSLRSVCRPMGYRTEAGMVRSFPGPALAVFGEE